MREKLVIRCSTERVCVPHIRKYTAFQSAWLKRKGDIVTVIEGFLDDAAFSRFVVYLRKKAGYLVSNIERQYTPKELQSAELVRIWISSTFEPTGEEVGTEYDYPCDVCKGGRIARGGLVLNLARAPRSADIAKTIAEDEWIVSKRFASLLKRHRVSGIVLHPVLSPSKRAVQGAWSQLQVSSVCAVSEQTRYGDAFNPDLDARKISSPCGHTINHIAYSELFIKRSSWDGSDVVRTDLFFGGHINLIYPYPYLLVSQRLYRLLKANKIRGFTDAEIVHLV
jgi:hypothetical protein